MKMPKLHSWIYHIVDTIEDFEYTTETYESLHKTYVKIPYRLSNKKEVEAQIMQNVIKKFNIFLIFRNISSFVILIIFSYRLAEEQ